MQWGLVITSSNVHPRMEKGKKLNGNSKGKKIRRGKRQNCHTSIRKLGAASRLEKKMNQVMEKEKTT